MSVVWLQRAAQFELAGINSDSLYNKRSSLCFLGKKVRSTKRHELTQKDVSVHFVRVRDRPFSFSRQTLLVSANYAYQALRISRNMRPGLPLLKALQDSFYVDEHAIREAIDRRSSFNAIHFDSVFKVDIFIPRADDFARMQLERRQLRSISSDTDQQIYVATAEDTILAKLRCY